MNQKRTSNNNPPRHDNRARNSQLTLFYRLFGLLAIGLLIVWALLLLPVFGVQAYPGWARTWRQTLLTVARGLPLELILPVYGVWLLVWSGLTFYLYGWDKGQAVAGGRRTPERVFHNLALLGGFAGGWAGRSYYRHKTLKPPFFVILTLATLLHLALVVLLLAGRFAT